MLVRVVRRLGRGLCLGAVGTAAVASFALAPRALGAQDSTSSKTHTVKRGDTLWDIAKTYLGDSFLWPDIYRLNVDVIEDPHWIYPGEVLKMPTEQATVIAVAPPVAAPPAASPPAAPVPATPVTVAVAPQAQPAPPPPEPSRPVFAPDPAPVAPERPAPPMSMMQEPKSVVRVGEYAAAPWVEVFDGPSFSGYIVQNGEASAIATADQSRLNLFDPVMIAPPAGMTASEHQLFISYRLGPIIENIGRVVIPTGIIQITRPNQPGEAAVGRVVKMFSEVAQYQRLIPYDSMPALVSGRPSRVSNGPIGQVLWVASGAVLPSVQSYVVVNMSSADGVKPGDQVEFFLPAQPPVDGRDIAIPEISIARAQVLRVTPYASTVMIEGQEQTKIVQGTAVRIAAKMP